MNKDEFIKIATNIHGDLYDYSLLEDTFPKSKYKVKIICKEHGIFEQTPQHHLDRGQGCKICKCGEKITTESFIKKSKQIHGDMYDYSKVQYINYKTYVDIICKEHGIFKQTPHCHLQGKGCNKCKGNKISKIKRIKLDEIIKRTNEIYGENMFDYSEMVYKNTGDVVRIKCLKHNEYFEQNLGSHLIGLNGCKSCQIEYRENEKIYVNKNKKNNEIFIEEHKKYHLENFGVDYYDYSKVEYVNNNTPVEIVCPIHGSFRTKRKEQGCRKCFVERTTKTKEQFIEDSIKIHGDKYDYSKVEYVNNKTYVEIICNKHGSWMQKPDNHLSGKGCPKCSLSFKLTKEHFIEKCKLIHGGILTIILKLSIKIHKHELK